MGTDIFNGIIVLLSIVRDVKVSKVLIIVKDVNKSVNNVWYGYVHCLWISSQ